MLKNIILCLLLLFSGNLCFSQPADSVYNKYLDFNLARFQGEKDKVIQLGEALIPLAGELPDKAKTNFYFAIGKVYEDDGDLKKALPFYEKVAIAEPNYYVVHRALGYIYLEDVKAIEKQLNASSNDEAKNKRLTVAYNAAVKKALPHLEKAQACDPSDETLAIIKLLYKNTRDTKGPDSLNKRLKELSKNCVDVLNDR